MHLLILTQPKKCNKSEEGVGDDSFGHFIPNHWRRLTPESIFHIFINIGKIDYKFGFKLMNNSPHESPEWVGKMFSCVYLTEILKNQRGKIQRSYLRNLCGPPTETTFIKDNHHSLQATHGRAVTGQQSNMLVGILLHLFKPAWKGPS